MPCSFIPAVTEAVARMAFVHHHRLSWWANYLLCRNRPFAGAWAICLECCNYCRPSWRFIVDDRAGHTDFQVVVSIRINKHIARIYYVRPFPVEIVIDYYGKQSPYVLFSILFCAVCQTSAVTPIAITKMIDRDLFR